MASETTESSSARRAFADRLTTRPLLLDGAMGTLLFSRGVPQRTSLEELVLSRPELIGSIHREYIDAGADVIETDTFSANRLRLAPLGLADRTSSINRRAGQLAREARDVASRDVMVAGSMGPVSTPIRGPQRTADDKLISAVTEQVEGLLEGGVDLLMIESASILEELLLTVSTARHLTDLPIVASMTFGEEVTAVDGTTPEEAAAALSHAGIDASGANCGAGPVNSLDALLRMRSTAGQTPLFVMPNAGLPSRVAGSFVYAADPDYFAGEADAFFGAGASLIGGCCGTTPEHVMRLRKVIDDRATRDTSQGNVTSPGTASPGAAIAPRTAAPETSQDEAGPPPTGLASALIDDHFVISVEIDPPRSVRIERTLEAARAIQAAGADLVNISDSAMARVRMGAMAVGFAIQSTLDLESLIHFTTRDRNLMALESELLGAHALGLRDILALTGDPPRVGDQPGATGIWDIDSIGLIGILARLNRGEDQAGRSIGAPAGFTIACALDPTSAELDVELDRLAAKIEAGAHIIMTQPIYSTEQWHRMMDSASARWGDSLPLPVLLGVLPLHSARHAEFLHNEVPGITIPDDVRSAMHAAGESGVDVGLETSLALLEEMAPLVRGTYVMPSFGRYEHSAELVRRIRPSVQPHLATRVAS